MVHLGDITKLSGYEVPSVDCVIGGSPCQNLSISGNREGLNGSESRLFLDQVRVIKEMRDADKQKGRKGNEVRPRYMVWENVAGALSCSNGADFLRVLEETARIADPNVTIPRPSGKWHRGGQFWQMDGVLPGGFSTHNSGESPSDVVESHLSQILQGGPLQKYYLSAKAASGILRRMRTKGRVLPPMLQKALEKKASEEAVV